jgi:hypothetical protein
MADSKGSRNKGYFFRAKRGWFTKTKAGKFKPLRDGNGTHLLHSSSHVGHPIAGNPKAGLHRFSGA